MNPQSQSDTVPVSAVPSETASTTAKEPATSKPAVEPSLDVLEDFEARSAWFHFQKWAGLVAQDLDHTVDEIIHRFGKHPKHLEH